MPSASGRRRCVFCGNHEVTLEHVYPQWMIALLGQRLSTMDVEVLRDGQTRKAPRPDAMVKQVCGLCNNEWMSALESDVQAFLPPMILGEAPVSLSSESQRTLASWVMKTMLMVELFYPAKDRRLPSRLFASFFADRTPSRRCAMWSAAYRGDHIGLRAYSTTLTLSHAATYTRDGMVEGGGGETRGVLQTLCLFRAIFQIAFFEVGPVPIRLIANPPGSIQLWPGRRPRVDWPHNMEGFDEQEFGALIVRTVNALSITRALS